MARQVRLCVRSCLLQLFGLCLCLTCVTMITYPDHMHGPPTHTPHAPATAPPPRRLRAQEGPSAAAITVSALAVFRRLPSSETLPCCRLSLAASDFTDTPVTGAKAITSFFAAAAAPLASAAVISTQAPGGGSFAAQIQPQTCVPSPLASSGRVATDNGQERTAWPHTMIGEGGGAGTGGPGLEGKTSASRDNPMMRHGVCDASDPSTIRPDRGEEKAAIFQEAGLGAFEGIDVSEQV